MQPEGTVGAAAAAGGWLGKTIAPARFVGFLGMSCASAIALNLVVEPLLAFILGFDVGAAAFIASLVPLMDSAQRDEIRRHARGNDANRRLVLVITVLVVSVVCSALALAASSDPSLGTRHCERWALALEGGSGDGPASCE